MTEFSFVGYESINVDEFLPILTKIIDDLNLIHNRFRHGSTISDTMRLMTIRQDSTDVKDYGSVKATNEMAVNTDDSLTSCTFDVAEECQLKEDCQELEEMLPKEYSGSGLVNGMKRFIKDLRSVKNSDFDESDGNEKPTAFDDSAIQYQELISEIDELKLTKLELEKQLQSYAKMADENENLKNTIKRLQNDIERQNDEIKNIHNKSWDDFNSLRDSYEDKKKQFEDMIMEKQHFEKLVEQLRKEKEDLEDKVEALQNNNDSELDKNYTILSDTLKKKREEVKERDTRIAQLENFIEEKESDMKNVKKELSKTKTDYKGLKEEFEENEIIKTESILEIKTLKKELKECRKQMENCVGMQASEDEINDFKRKIRTLENEKAKTDKEKVEFQKSVNDMRAKLEEATKRCQNYDTQIKEVETMYEGKLKEKDEAIKALDADIEAKKKAFGTMRAKISKSQEESPNETNRLTFQLNAKDMEIENMHLKIDNLNETLERLFKENELEKNEKNQLKNEIENIKKLNFVSSKPSKPEPLPKPKPGNKGQFPDWWKEHMTTPVDMSNFTNMATLSCPNCHKLIPQLEITNHFEKCVLQNA